VHELGWAGQKTALTNKLSVRTSGYLKDYAMPGLPEGVYSYDIMYNGKVVCSNTLSATRENWEAGLLDITEVVPDFYTSLSGHIVNDQFPNEVFRNYGNKVVINEEEYDSDITDDFLDHSKDKVSERSENEIRFEKIGSLGKYSIDLSATHIDGNEVRYYGKCLEIPIVDVRDLSGDSVFYPSGALHPTKNVMDVSGMYSDSRSTEMTVHVPYWYAYFGRTFLYTDEHDSLKGCTPWIKTSVTVKNTSISGEEWEQRDNNITFRKTTLGTNERLAGESNGYRYMTYADENTRDPHRWLVKTGHYNVEFKKMSDESTLYESSTTVSGRNAECIADNFGMNTLNIMFMQKRPDTGKYHVLNPGKFRLTYEDLSGNIKSYYDNINENIHGSTCLSREFRREVEVCQKKNDEETMLCSYYNDITQQMFMLKMLPQTGTLGIEVFYTTDPRRRPAYCRWHIQSRLRACIQRQWLLKEE